ncbi:hypothetical protein [Williamsia sp.]|uniref:hypothetical protein n=1 Tax=Williamsia sp. TaxID=1872085 RepID=UPI0025E21E5E|nr:hypothetical protein [Williamsia sp.]
MRVSIKTDDRLADDVVHSHQALALDLWRGQDFTDRNRGRAWSWVPFYDGELDDTPDTAESIAARMNRTYTLSGDEQSDRDAMKADPAGQISWLSGVLAARIHTYPVWQDRFFDDHGVRVDLISEVTSLTQRALNLRDKTDVLGPAPKGHLRSDDEVVAAYIEKARVLDRGMDAALERLQSLDRYCDIVAGIQRRKNKYDWMERANSIDDLELLIDDDLDRRQSDSVREAGTMSEMLAAVYLDTLTPITESLTLAPVTE